MTITNRRAAIGALTAAPFMPAATIAASPLPADDPAFAAIDA